MIFAINTTSGRPALLIAALSTACALLVACGVPSSPENAVNQAEGDGAFALKQELHIVGPGLAIVCAGPQGERHFSDAQARGCVRRVSRGYARGVRQSLRHH
jgi:hypothetical protein